MPKCNFNKIACNFIEIALRHGCSPVNLQHIFRELFSKNTPGGLPLNLSKLLSEKELSYPLVAILRKISELIQ